MVRPAYPPSTLAGVLDLVESARRDNTDHYVHLRDLRFEVANPQPVPLHEQIALACAAKDAPARVRLREDGWPRVFRFLGLPAGFGETLPASMVTSSLNYKLAARADELALMRVRHAEGSAVLRGLLPPSHVRLDDRQVLQQLLRLAGASELRPVNVAIREDLLHVRLVDHREVDVGRGQERDLVHPGIDIHNSETGAGALSVGRCLYRVVCANGLVFPEGRAQLRRWRHAGSDAATLRRQLAEALRASLAEMRGLTDRYRGLHGVPLVEPGETLETFMRAHKLGSPRGRTGERILLEMGRTGDLFGRSLFDFVQAVTAVARTLDVDKRLRFEAAAGRLVAEGGVVAPPRIA
ncbi:MAG TPA: DUF932 domain-containing protein [Candidatus Krumholzibacteria bacterium]|nr:DUF932 domain-containing protein [Candidatus Krumholzibacteria bacterium]HPD73362.1 DUF932 domain-containing protein [Candidatus Krumholzibacteria bacterium]HRY42117.1 DUF932 domain-containing protein [Candidatus Krumholzibacteria bacterium]